MTSWWRGACCYGWYGAAGASTLWLGFTAALFLPGCAPEAECGLLVVYAGALLASGGRLRMILGTVWETRNQREVGDGRAPLLLWSLFLMIVPTLVGRLHGRSSPTVQTRCPGGGLSREPPSRTFVGRWRSRSCSSRVEERKTSSREGATGRGAWRSRGRRYGNGEPWTTTGRDVCRGSRRR